MVAKVPVLVSNIDGPIENRKKWFCMVVLFISGDFIDCALKIKEIINNYAYYTSGKRIEEIRKYAIANFDISSTANLYLDEYYKQINGTLCKKFNLRINFSGFLKISWITFSVISITILVFLSEWIQKTGIINIPTGFRHFAILFLFFCNWIVFGRPFRLNQLYVLGIVFILVYLLIAFIFVKVSLLNYVLGIGFTFLFVPIFVFGSNTKTNMDVIVKIFKYLLVFFILASIGPIF